MQEAKAEKTVLVADDNRFIRLLVQTALRPLHVELLEAVDGVEAISAALSHKPDLILLDVVMPRVDGFAALKEMRSHDKLANTVIVMLTTAASEKDIQTGRDSGADDHIVKPFEASDLRNRVQELLNRGRPRA